MAEKYRKSRKSDLVMKEDDSDSDEVKMMQDLAPTDEFDDDDKILDVSEVRKPKWSRSKKKDKQLNLK